MKTLLVILLSGCITSAFSQETDFQKFRLWQKGKVIKQLPDSLKKKPNQPDDISIHSPREQGNMPVLRFENKKTYLGNNGTGADIYSMAPDNMPCLTPDSTFVSNMPVKGYTIKSRPIVSGRPGLNSLKYGPPKKLYSKPPTN